MWIDSAAAGLLRRYSRGIKFVIILTCALAALGAAALFYMNPATYDTLLLITPKSALQRGVAYDIIEDINGKEFLITYVLEESATAEAVNSRSAVTVRATNYTYPHVLRLVMKNGGFFTKSHQEQKLKNAVLNEKAAFNLFGSVEISGNELTLNKEKYRVIGVISDEEGMPHVYIPVTLRQQSKPNSFACRLDDNVSEALVKVGLKQIGVTDGGYEFTRGTVVDRAVRAVREWVGTIS